MDADSWTSRLSSVSQCYQSAFQSRSDFFTGLEEIEGDDDIREEFSCPFCAESFKIQVEDTVDDERPPRGRDRPSAAARLAGGSRTPVIQENLDRPVTAGHLENVLNDFQTRMAAIMEEQIKNNMLFFQISPGREVAEPHKGKSQEGRPGTSRPPRQELTRPLSKGKQPAASEPRRKMDWKLVVRPGDNVPPTGHKMETDAREYLEAKRVVALQRSASGSIPYMKDPPLREAKHPEVKKVEEATQPNKSLPKKAETWAMTSMTTSSKRSRRSEPAASAEPIEFSKDQYSILMEIKDQHELKAPAEMKTPYRDKSKYCHFHKDCGHETNECKHLKRALEDLARKGKMNSYLPSSGRKFQKKDNRQGRRKDDESTDKDVVMQVARECYLTTLRPSSWKEKSERPKAMEDESAEKMKGHINELKQEVEKA
ncbi:hypothetical protein BVRB_7g165750 [Beta vulgaris subsp. vulgaris]|nr:hypothetical protein BVRB_7g165750 [Beta vulgaris subsp. vulgaris]